MTAPELDPALQGAPSLATQKNRALHKLAEEVNLMVQLIDRLKACTGLRPRDKYSPDPYLPDDHLRAIERGDYRRAYQLITAHGNSISPQGSSPTST
jgi:hypothetical protein